ncbi:MAG: glutamate-1-semialdehyde 2,1-aminomutase [Actinomycetes bacterium]
MYVEQQRGTSRPEPDRFERSAEASARLGALVPGGAHTYAKGEDQYPEHMAPVITHGRGAHVWDVDGHDLIEYGSGLRAVSLGHVHPRVTEAARRALDLGANFTRPSHLELEAAEALLGVLPRADMVKFAKNGSDVTTAAVRLARAVTGRDLVAVCRDHPFFSTDDWFIGTTPMAAGIPAPVRALTLGFAYDDLTDLERLFAAHPGRIACLVMEAATGVEPSPGYLAGVRRLCDAHGTLLVFDEMITGFRWSVGGAQETYGVTPDLSTFGKALGNGFAVAALAGRREVMERGGTSHGGERVFLLSTTHGAETHSLAAACAVIETYTSEPVIETLEARGERLRAGVRRAAAEAGVGDHVLVLGRTSNLVHATLDADGQRSQAFRTLFLQELLRRGVLAPSFVVSAALTEDDVDATVDAVFEACQVYRRALEDGVEHYLHGRPVKPVFRPYA